MDILAILTSQWNNPQILREIKQRNRRKRMQIHLTLNTVCLGSRATRIRYNCKHKIYQVPQARNYLLFEFLYHYSNYYRNCILVSSSVCYWSLLPDSTQTDRINNICMYYVGNTIRVVFIVIIRCLGYQWLFFFAPFPKCSNEPEVDS